LIWEAADVPWEKAGIVIKGTLQQFIDPTGEFPTGLRGLFLFWHDWHP
jgi:hypothetical protein